MNAQQEILHGWIQQPKVLPPKHLFRWQDFHALGIIEAEESILRKNAKAIAYRIGPQALIIEPARTSNKKIRILFKNLKQPVGYVAMDASEDFLQTHSDVLKRLKPKKRVVFSSGLTLENLDPIEAIQTLKRFHKIIQDQGGLLVGIDMQKFSFAKLTEYASEAGFCLRQFWRDNYRHYCLYYFERID